MNTIPWYKSRILQGILASLVSQALARSNLASVISSDQALAIINWGLDGISAAALAYATHARVTKPSPPVSLTKASAASDNAAAAANLASTTAANDSTIQPPK